MKTLILTTVISFITIVTSAQGRYYTLQECGCDSLKYIEKNYEDNPTRYIGKTVAFFVDECELTLEEFFPDVYLAMEGVMQENHGKIIGLFLKFYQDDYLYTVLLEFSSPYSYTEDDFDSIENSDYSETWKLVYYNFFKNFKIKEIYIYKEKDGKSIKNYRRP